MMKWHGSCLHNAGSGSGEGPRAVRRSPGETVVVGVVGTPHVGAVDILAILHGATKASAAAVGAPTAPAPGDGANAVG